MEDPKNPHTAHPEPDACKGSGDADPTSTGTGGARATAPPLPAVPALCPHCHKVWGGSGAPQLDEAVCPKCEYRSELVRLGEKFAELEVVLGEIVQEELKRSKAQGWSNVVELHRKLEVITDSTGRIRRKIMSAAVVMATGMSGEGL